MAAPNLSDVVLAARRLGCTVAVQRRHGHLRFSHPLAERPVTVHGVRRVAPARLVIWLRRIEADIADLREVFGGTLWHRPCKSLGGAATQHEEEEP